MLTESRRVPGSRHSTVRPALEPHRVAVREGPRPGVVQVALGVEGAGDDRRRAWREDEDHPGEALRQQQGRQGGCRPQAVRRRGVDGVLQHFGCGCRDGHDVQDENDIGDGARGWDDGELDEGCRRRHEQACSPTVSFWAPLFLPSSGGGDGALFLFLGEIQNGRAKQC